MTVKKETRGDRVIRFIETFCNIPQGKGRGKPLKLLPFQRKFILDVYDNPAGTSRAYLSMPRKNGKTALIACLALAHIAGPEAIQNSQIISGARSREQAGLVYKLAAQMVALSPRLSALVKATPSSKKLVGLTANVEFHAISAEAGTAHGLSPVVAILDEVGQVRGPVDAFVEAIETSQGAYENEALLIAISTQARTDADLFSQWLDDAETSKDPRIVSHLYTAPDGCEVMDREAWAVANPALGVFRSLPDLEDFATQAHRLPSKEPSFRWLFLNQRIEAVAPFVAPAIWKACGAVPMPDFGGRPVYAGLDLSTTNDLTAFVPIAADDTGVWHVRPTFWLPAQGLAEKSSADRTPWDQWARLGHLETTPGPTVDYSFVAEWLWRFCQANDVRKIGFDEWNFAFLKPWLMKSGFPEESLEGDGAIFQVHRQGWKSMSPALRELEAALLNERMAHGNHPVLAVCARNAVVTTDEQGNRKLSKKKANGRIDGLVALAMAMSVAGTWEATPTADVMAMIA